MTPGDYTVLRCRSYLMCSRYAVPDLSSQMPSGERGGVLFTILFVDEETDTLQVIIDNVTYPLIVDE